MNYVHEYQFKVKLTAEIHYYMYIVYVPPALLIGDFFLTFLCLSLPFLLSLTPFSPPSLPPPSFLPPLSLSSELFGDVNTGINFDRYEDIPVEATGEGCPRNITNFEECKFEEIVRENIKVLWIT